MSNTIAFGNFNRNFSYEIIAGKKRRIYTSKRKAKYYYIYKNGKEVKRYLTKTQYHQLRRRKKGIKETKNNKRIAVERRKETKSKKVKRIKIILDCHGTVRGDIIYPSDKLPIFTYITRTQIGYVDYGLDDYSINTLDNVINIGYLYKQYLSRNIELFNKKGNIYHINKRGKQYQNVLRHNIRFANTSVSIRNNKDRFKNSPFKLLKIHSKNKEGIINSNLTFTEKDHWIYIVDENNKLTKYIINDDSKNIFLEEVDIDFQYTKYLNITLEKLLKHLKTHFDTKIQGNYELEIYSSGCRSFNCSKSDKYKLLKKTETYYEQISKAFNIKLAQFDSIESFFIFDKKWNELTKTQAKVFLEAYKITLKSYQIKKTNIPENFKIKSNNLNNNSIVSALWEHFVKCIESDISGEELYFVIKLLIHFVNNYNYLRFIILPIDTLSNQEFSINQATNLDYNSESSEYLNKFEIKMEGLVSDDNIISFMKTFNKLILQQFIRNTVNYWLKEIKLQKLKFIVNKLGYKYNLDKLILASKNNIITILKKIRPECKKPWYRSFIKSLVKLRIDNVTAEEWQLKVPYPELNNLN